MERAAYLDMVELEEKHWWFVARRRIIKAFICKLPIPRHAQILELGCGSGGNLDMLSSFGQVYAAEYDAQSRTVAQARGIAKEIRPCKLPEEVPFANQAFDLIVMLDVLEHIEDDVTTLEVVRPLLANSGWLVITVPAFPFLWSPHDIRLHHYRRYTKESLRSRLEAAGYALRYLGFFNAIFFPVVASIRLVKKVLNQEAAPSEAPAELKRPSRPLNALLSHIFGVERLAMGRFSFPFGVSLIASAQANAHAVDRPPRRRN